MSVYKRESRWHFRVWVDLPGGSSKRLRGTTKPGTPNTKKATEQAQREAVFEALHPQQQRKESENENPKAIPLVGDYIKTYLEVISTQGMLTGRLAAKQRILKVEIEPEFGHLRLDEVKQIHVDRYTTRLLSGAKPSKRRKARKPLVLKTVNNILTVLGCLLKYAHKNDLIGPVKLTLHSKTDETELEALGNDEFEKLVAACVDLRYRVALLLAHDAGLRIGEVRGIRWRDVDEVEGRLNIRQQINKFGQVSSTKGKRARMIPLLIGGQLHHALKQLMPADRAEWAGAGLIITRGEDFPTADTRVTDPIPYETMRNTIHRLYSAAGVDTPSLPWHSLRHAYCTTLANSGAPIHHVQRMAGHKSIETTLRYMHSDEDALKRSMAKAFGKGEAQND